MNDFDLIGKVIVLTGASSGFGRGVALELAKAGASLVLAARSVRALHGLARECRAAGTRVVVVPTDVSEEEGMRQLAATALREYGYIDIWINDAGVGSVGRFDEVPLADHLKVLRTNLLGTVAGSYHALKHFRERGKGTLINVASVIGKIPAPYYGSYTASKYGIVGLDASLRQEIDLAGLDHIHVCTVMPMAMDTPFFDDASNYTGKIAEPIPPLYDADKVVQAIVGLATKPQKEIIVGAVGRVMTAAHSILPATVEKMMGAQTHAAQMKKAKSAPHTQGAVHKPSENGVVHSPRLDKRKSKGAVKERSKSQRPGR